MSYTILNSSGATITTVADSTFNTATNLQLPGPNTVGYGQKLNENLVYLLENFAASTAPGSEYSIISGAPITGQLWYDTGNKVLKIYDATVGSFTPLAGVTNASYPAGTYPTPGKNGDFFYNTLTQQLFITESGSWSLIGPQFTAQQGTSGTTLITTVDTNGGTHNVVGINSAGRLVAVLSADSTFTPQYPIDNPGVGSPTVFPTIGPGITFANTIQNIGLTATLNGNVLSPTSSLVVVNTLPSTAVFTGNLSGNVNGNVYGNIFASTITSANLASTNIYGTVQTAVQPNITSLGTLTSLNVSGSVTFSSLPTYGGVALATQGGSASFSKIDNTPIGTITPNIGAFTNLTSSGTVSGTGFTNIFASPPLAGIGTTVPQSGVFTTLRANSLDYTVIGSTSAAAGSFTSLNVSGATTLNGSVTLGASTSLSLQGITASGTITASSIVGTSSIQGTISAASASQPNITTMAGLTSAASLSTVGTIVTGTWNGTSVRPQYGGTGTSGSLTGIPYANGTSNWTQATNTQLATALTGSAPSISGANITGIPFNNITPNTGFYLLNGVPSFTGSLTLGSGSPSLTGSYNINTGYLTVTNSLTIPAASSTQYGVVKVDGTTITINGSGQLVGASAAVDAGSLGGTTLKSTIVNSSLTTVGTLGSLNVSGAISSGSLSVSGAISGGSLASNGALTGQAVSIGGTIAATGPNGYISASKDITAFTGSDQSLKENIRPITGALSAVLGIGGKTFDWTDAVIAERGGEDGYLIRKQDFGVVAQDVLREFPLGVRQRPSGILAVDYEKLCALAFAAIAELTARVNELESKLK